MSLYKAILTLNIPHQPVEVKGKYYFLHDIKTCVIMNSFEQDEVMETPLSLIGRRIKVDTRYLNLHGVIKGALIAKIRVHIDLVEHIQITNLESF